MSVESPTIEKNFDKFPMLMSALQLNLRYSSVSNFNNFIIDDSGALTTQSISVSKIS